MHPLFSHLEAVCRILDAGGIPYFLAGGTMLGAVRDQQLIAHDLDFDVDCFSDDEARIFALTDEFAAAGLTLRHKLNLSPIPFDPNQTERAAPADTTARCIKICHDGAPIGDIYLFTRFADGMTRRYDFNSNTYYNPKMTLPTWFYEEPATVYLEGRPFKTFREPELVCGKVYGHDWRTPLSKGSFEPGRNNNSGSVLDADIESLSLHALSRGWRPDYASCPAWPRPVDWVNSYAGRNWINTHEPLLREEVAQVIPSIDMPAQGMTRAEFDFRLQLSAAIGMRAANDELGKIREQRAADKARYEALKLKLESEKQKWRRPIRTLVASIGKAWRKRQEGKNGKG